MPFWGPFTNVRNHFGSVWLDSSARELGANQKVGRFCWMVAFHPGNQHLSLHLIAASDSCRMVNTKGRMISVASQHEDPPDCWDETIKLPCFRCCKVHGTQNFGPCLGGTCWKAWNSWVTNNDLIHSHQGSRRLWKIWQIWLERCATKYLSPRENSKHEASKWRWWDRSPWLKKLETTTG